MIPDLTINAPNKLKEKTKIDKRIVQILKIDDLTRLISTSGLILIVCSGLLYSIGTFFYSSKTIKYSHAIWHLFVMAGSITHYFFVLYFVIQ